MPSDHFYGIRRLQPADLPLLIEHHLRLDADARRLRFGYALKDDVVEAQLRKINFRDSKIWGLFAGNKIVGSAMLVPLNKKCVEAAFTLEHEWRGFGLGKQLLDVALEYAYSQERSKDVVIVHMYENAPMRQIARRLPGIEERIDSDVQKTVTIDEWGERRFWVNSMTEMAEF